MPRRNSASTSDYDVAVIGAGNIGMSIARALAPDYKIALFDKGKAGKGAAWAAGGMLRPISEAERDKDYLRMCLQSAALYPQYVRSLEEETGMDLEYRTEGSILLAFDEAEKKTLKKKHRLALDNGVGARLLSPKEVQNEEPSIGKEPLAGLHMPCDVQLSNRALVEALFRSCQQRGVTIIENTHIESIKKETNGIVLKSNDGEWRCALVVICAGAHSKELTADLDITPIKGHMCRLKGKGTRLRHIISRHPLYLIPRNDGSVIVGSTEEDVGFDESVDDDTIQALKDRAAEIAPALKEAKVLESWVGFRPKPVPEKPYLGKLSEGVFAAAGHHRNGILLTPITAKLLTKEIKHELARVIA